MDSITITFFIFVLAASVFTLIIAAKALLKKDLIDAMKIPRSKKDKMRKYSKPVNIICKTFISAYIIIALVFVIVPGVIDLPRVFTGNYEREICTACDTYEYKTDIWAHFTTQKGDELGLMVFDNSYEQGEKYIVYYLPHIRFGTILLI